MLNVWTKRNCSSSQKSKKWLIEHKVPFVEKKLGKQRLTKKEFFHILFLSENGTTDVLSKQSMIYSKLEHELADMQLSQLWILSCQYPSLLRSPIIFDDKNLLIGFNTDEIRVLITKEQRKIDQYQNLMAHPLNPEIVKRNFLIGTNSE